MGHDGARRHAEGEHEPEREFGHGERVGVGAVDDVDACLHGGRNVDGIQAGAGPDRFVLLDDLCTVLESSSLCAMGSMTPKPVRSALEFFPEDFGQLGAEDR